jgi:hypothetical protein
MTRVSCGPVPVEPPEHEHDEPARRARHTYLRHTRLCTDQPACAIESDGLEIRQMLKQLAPLRFRSRRLVHTYRLYIRACSTRPPSMSAQQPPWRVPEPDSAAPVLKVYNSLTRTKVRMSHTLAFYTCRRECEPIDRICAPERAPCQVVQLRAHRLRRVAHGPCTVRRAPTSVPHSLTSVGAQKLRDTGHPAPDHDRLLRVRRALRAERDRHRRQGPRACVPDPSPFLLTRTQIIIRARQTHLVDGFRAQHTALTPALAETLLAAWDAYARAKLPKGLQLPADSAELAFDAWPALHAGVQAAPARRADALRRDEKFDLHMSTLVRRRARRGGVGR